MEEPWRIELFGGLRARRGAWTVTRFRTEKTAALLAYLALRPGRPRPREGLIQLLWPEDAFNAARHKLSVALSSLRQQLEPPGVEYGAVLVADRQTIGLDAAAVSTDVSEFEAALAAAAQAGSAGE